MSTTITLVNPEAYYATEHACEAHPGWPLHLTTECRLLAGVRPFSEHIACSVCDLEWGVGAVSQHERCARLTDSGDREFAQPAISYQRGDGHVTIHVTDVYA